VGKYRTGVRVREKKKGIHPIWRGIGCLIILIVPVLSYAIALLTFPIFYNAHLVPLNLLGTPQVPTWMWYSPNFASFMQTIIGQPNLKGILLLAFAYTLFIGGFMSLIYAIIWRQFGPSRYGPLDAEPIRTKKVKKYTR